MFWTTSCVMSVREPGVGASLPPSSAPMSPVFSITVNTAGRPSTHALVGSSTSHWSRREGTGLGTSPSAGTERQRGEGGVGVAKSLYK